MTAEAQASTTGIRQAMVSNCDWGVAHTAEIHYAETRPMPINLPKFSLPFTTDCSGFATMMAKWSGAKDPNGSGFNGYGNTDTMLAHSPHISRDQSQAGDFVVFGTHPSTHVVVLAESAAGGHDAVCISHGQEAGPLRVTLSVEASSHSGEPLTFLQLQGGGSPPPPPPPPGHNPFCPLAVDGSFGPLTTKALQWKLGVATDGSFGPITKTALQRYLHVPADGVIGPVTVKALQRHVGATPDGDWGPLTTKALQTSLNANRF